MTLHPPIPLWPFLVPLLAAAALAVLWWSARAAAALPTGRRTAAVGARTLSVALLALIVLNPGSWQQPEAESASSFIVLADRSASMDVPDEPDGTRWDAARELAVKALAAAADAGYHAVPGTFTGALDPTAPDSPQAWRQLVADGDATVLAPALDSAIAAESAARRTPAAVLVLSDGRQSGVPVDPDAAVARAVAFGAPVHTVALGGEWQARDLRLSAARRQVLAYPGRPLRVPVVVASSGLGPLEVEVVLRGPDGEPLASTTTRLAADGQAIASLDLEAPEEGGVFTIETPVHPDEEIEANNRDTVRIRVLSGSTRILIAEGAPYWDSKFLAQLLRQAPFLEVDSVHRLSDDRYFFLSHEGEADDTSEDAGIETDDGARPIFPSSAAELDRYDIVIFGKSCEPFLADGRLDLLTRFVRDRGGAVLFSRGKSYSREFPGIEALEPVEWGSGQIAGLRFEPVAEGEIAGLFGEALPAADDPIWPSLPTLHGGREIQTTKPFARTLARGISDPGTATPALVVRRFGMGVTALVNADGLWQWDFFPEAREMGNMYEEFWTQLTLWLASYSEFLPGQDFSLRASAMRVFPGETVNMDISWRGAGAPPPPRVEVWQGDEVAATLVATTAPSDDGRPRWQTSWTPDRPGEFRLQLAHEGPAAEAGTPEAPLTVASSPGERDILDADPDYLAAISQASGGRTMRSADVAAFLADLEQAARPATRGQPVFEPGWPRTPVFLMLLGLLAVDWTLRRRHGLA